MDRVLRRSLGVSELAKADATVKPAPPVESELPTDEFDIPEFEDWSTLKERIANEKSEKNPQVVMPQELMDEELEEVEMLGEDSDMSANVHDEL